jgi:hypothetical protein
MLEAIGAAPGSASEIDWHQAWRSSPEYQAIQDELARLRALTAERPSIEDGNDLTSYREFATPLWQQFLVVTERVFQQYWRTPTYIYSQICLCITARLIVGLVFVNAPLSIQGLQNQVFAIFELSSIFGQLVEQQMPQFVTQR